MQLIVLGLNHKTAPVEVREGFNFSADRIARILRRLRNYDNLDEAVLLSTCNRTEFYMVLEEPVSGMKFIQTLVKHLAGDGYKTEYFYNLSGVNCVRHLFKVASSLDSLVIGEGQILSQIKNAYQIARENSITGTIFNTISTAPLPQASACAPKPKSLTARYRYQAPPLTLPWMFWAALKTQIF